MNKEQYDITFNEGEKDGYNPYRYDSEPLGDAVAPESEADLQRQLKEVESRKVNGHYTCDSDTSLACGIKAQLFRMELDKDQK